MRRCKNDKNVKNCSSLLLIIFIKHFKSNSYYGIFINLFL